MILITLSIKRKINFSNLIVNIYIFEKEQSFMFDLTPYIKLKHLQIACWFNLNYSWKNLSCYLSIFLLRQSKNK